MVRAVNEYGGSGSGYSEKIRWDKGSGAESRPRGRFNQSVTPMRSTAYSQWRLAPATLALGVSVLLSPTLGRAEEGAEASSRSPELEQRLSAALAAKGPSYRPRTEHLLEDGRPRFTNRLILEDSPYLIQHAHNPVDWYPWGPEAFDRARREGKLVFLSIGYSTCYWCHVMERESFEDLEIAGFLNRDFVAVKIDREVRPDLDQVYMTAVQLLGGQGGWPMTSILTPEAETIIAGTYFPPQELRRLLEGVEALWQEEPEELRAQARRVAAAVTWTLETARRATELAEDLAEGAAARLAADYDELQGGYGAAPKFPREPQLQLLLDQALRSGDAASETAALLTLRSMAQGGIHDQVGGGFHRYAIDNDWLVPHFEKMLYNQAQLARAYAAAWRLTGDPGFARVARRALDFVLRDLSSPEGAFYSATDAESEGEEGRFFLWTTAEIRAALPGDAAELAIRLFGVTEAGNFEGRNILHFPRSPEELARAEGLALGELFQRLDSITARLESARSVRPKPHRDEKVLTGWNGLMITALAEVGDTLGEPRYLAAAERAAELLWTRARDADGTLQRVYLEGRASVPALQEDYAFLGEGMIALYDVTGDARWLERAQGLADAMWTRFADPKGGGLYMAEPDDTPQMARPKDLADGPMPSGHSAALSLFSGLARRTEEPVYAERARTLVAAISGQVARAPEDFPSLLVALDRLRLGETGPRQYAAQGAVRVHARTRPAEAEKASLPARGRLIVEIDMRPGWHINAHRPLEDDLIGTILTGVEGRGWRLGDAIYPQPEVLRLGFTREPLALYQGKVRIGASYDPDPRAAVAEPTPSIPLKLRLQACSDRFCLAPETLALEVPTAAP